MCVYCCWTASDFDAEASALTSAGELDIAGAGAVRQVGPLLTQQLGVCGGRMGVQMSGWEGVTV